MTVPPVANKSSTIKILAPCSIASLCISIILLPYSKSYSVLTTSPGNLPSFLTGTNPLSNFNARGAPIKNPRASIPKTKSISLSSYRLAILLIASL